MHPVDATDAATMAATTDAIDVVNLIGKDVDVGMAMNTTDMNLEAKVVVVGIGTNTLP